MSIKQIKESLKEAFSPEAICCFCGKPIKKGELVQIQLAFEDGASQDLAAHGLCLKEKLDPAVPFLAPEELDHE